MTQDSWSETDPKINDILIFRMGCFRNFAEAGRRASLLDLHFFGLVDIQSYRIARYSSFFGPLDTPEFRAAGYSDFSGRSIFKQMGLLDIQRPSGRSMFKVFGPLSILTFRTVDV